MRILIAFVVLLTLTGPTQATADGPRCTSTYPRGFKVTKPPIPKPNKRLTGSNQTCTNGEFGATWRMCVQRYSL